MQADPFSDECNDERDISNWSSQMLFNRVKHRLGLFPGAQSAKSGYNKRVNSVEWPSIWLSSSLMKHDWGNICDGSSLQVVTNTRVKYRWLAYSSSDLSRWSENLWVSFSSRFFKKTKQECCWRLMKADSELKNLVLWYQMLESEVVNAET